MGVYATANGVTGIFGFLITTESFVGYLLTFLVASAVAFGISYFLFKDPEDAASSAKKEEAPKAEEDVINLDQSFDDANVYSPLKGTAIPLEEVPDETFATGVLGLGAAVIPSTGKVVAPADGEVSTLFETKHAIGLSLDNGMEMLIHIGINTVELAGEGFTAHVADGDRITRGQTLITFDKAFIESKGYKMATPVIITNPDDYAEIGFAAGGEINFLDRLIQTKKG
jgi:PTS system sucrose-specific IIC component